MPARLGQELPEVALSYAVLALSWPWLQPKAELPASLRPALCEALSIHCAHGV